MRIVADDATRPEAIAGRLGPHDTAPAPPAGPRSGTASGGCGMAGRRALVLAAFVTWLALPAGPALAGDEAPRGLWGSAADCSQWRAGEPDTPAVGPYEITDQWIRRWRFYCFIGNEAPMSERGDEWAMIVMCGEGTSTQRYALELTTVPEEGLTMRWQMVGEADAHMVGPLERCDEDQR